MLEAGFWTLFAASSLILGAVLAQKLKFSDATVGEAMAFGAGALISAIAYELIPEASLDERHVWVSFGIGALVFYAADSVLERRSGGANAGKAIALGALLDGIPESMVLGISLSVGGSVTVGFLAAVFVSNIPEALSATSDLSAHMTSRAIYRLWIGITAISGAAGVVGYALAEALPLADGRDVQAFAAGAVLTMLASSMVPHRRRPAGGAVHRPGLRHRRGAHHVRLTSPADRRSPRRLSRLFAPTFLHAVSTLPPRTPV